eukprot:1945403-Amphidinium_carterae.4
MSPYPAPCIDSAQAGVESWGIPDSESPMALWKGCGESKSVSVRKCGGKQGGESEVVGSGARAISPKVVMEGKTELASKITTCNNIRSQRKAREHTLQGNQS